MSVQAFPLEHYIQIVISSDGQNADLQFSHCEDDFSVARQELEQLIQARGIVYGLDSKLIGEIVQNPKNFLHAAVTIASGLPSVEGKPGYIRFFHDFDNETRKPLVLEDGKVDFKQLGTMPNIKKGQIIAERIPATEGSPGMTVTGEAIKAKAGAEARFKIGKNVVADPGHKAIYAAIDGLLTRTEKDKINVFPVYEVNGNVDFSIGNIDFVGTVVIRGSVLGGFRVKASGDIRVTGSVEAAELQAGGSIDISGGILGQNKGLIKAGVNVKSSFIQEGIVEAGEDVSVFQSIMHSTIRAGHTVLCSGSKGLIVGGLVQAGKHIVARTIGNSMSTVTALESGVVPELRNELALLRGELRTGSENLDKAEKALSLLDQLAAAGSLTPAKLAMRVKLQHTKRQAVERLYQIKERILEIEKSLEDSDQASIDVIGAVYSGVKIVIGRHTKFVKDATSRATFKISNGEIVLIPL